MKLPPPFSDGEWGLFNLSAVPGETRDLSETEPERLKAMIVSHKRYAEEVGVVPPDLHELLQRMGIDQPEQ